MDPRIKKTIDYYSLKAADWANKHQWTNGHSWWLEEMSKFKVYLPKGGILEIGSGAGVDAGDLIGLGYDYTGIDPSLGMVKIGAKKNPGGKFICTAVESMDFPDNYFDGFWAPAVLLHIPKNLIGNNLVKIRGVCREGAVGFIAVMIGNKEEEDVETGRWFAYYQKDELTNVLTKSGFEIIDNGGIKHDPRPGKTDWLIFYVKRKEK